MRLQEVYEIIKNANLNDFYVNSDDELTFVYKEDISLTITKVDEKKDELFSNCKELFYYANGEEKSLVNSKFTLIKGLMELEEHSDYSGVLNNKWSVEFCNKRIFTINNSSIYKTHLLNYYFPTAVNDFYDYEKNFAAIVNEYFHCRKLLDAKELFDSVTTVKSSTFDSFIGHK